MITRPFQLFIGKDTAINANITGGEILSALMTGSGTDELGDGEIKVLDKNFNVLAPAATVADSDTIYIAMGLTKTFTLAPESGSAITARKIKISDPIKSGHVKLYSGKAYVAKVEQVSTTAITGATAGRQYVIRAIYKDLYEHPGPYIQEWRYTAVAADSTPATFATAIAAVINKDPNARVIASVSSDDLLLTGKAIPSCTTGLSDIDEFDMVKFDLFVNYIDANGREVTFKIPAEVAAKTGTGTWELMRDLEKDAWGYQGVTNRREFPVILPDFRTSTALTYNILTIEHEIPYKTPNNLYLETTQVRTIVAFQNGTNGDAQQTFVLGQLNTWMASTPGAFPNVSVM